MDTHNASRLIRRYTLAGIVVGFGFPFTAWVIEFVHDGLPWALDSIWQLHATNPSVWIIDTAPLVLGVFARQIGIAKHAEQARKESEARLQHIIDHAVEIICRTDMHGRFTFVNAAMSRILQYSREELIGQHYSRILHPDSREAARALYVSQLKQRTPTAYHEVRVLCKDGTSLWFGQNVRLVMERGHVVGFQTIGRDITERKRAEDVLRGREELLRRIVETVEDGIYIVDRSGKMTFANAAVERILGVSREEIAQRAFNDPVWQLTTVDGKPFPDDQQPFSQIMRSKQPVFNVEQSVLHPDGRRVILSINAAPLLDDNGQVSGEVAVMTDITERKAVERMKNEFVSTVSHELRTPLTSIVGSLGLVMGGAAGEVSPQARAMLDIAHKNSARLVSLINDILDIEKIESGKMVFQFKPLELMLLIDQAVESLRAYADQYGVRLEITEQVAGARVNADENRLIQVLTNLLSNAVKFSPKNDVVTISVARRDHTLRVQVRDRGRGIPPEFRARIFQRFAQADSSDTRQRGGTGLGLSIAKAIVEKHGGHIGFESELGVGTLFFFELPEWQAPDIHPAAPVEGASAALPARILVCEDDRDIATLLMLMLEQAGFQADIARDAARAKQLLAQTRYAAMTLDIALPDQNGLALFRELRGKAETRNLPVIFVSVTAQEGRAELNGDAVMVVDWIDKPIDQDRLTAAVRQAVGQPSSRTPRILHVEDDPDICQVVAGIVTNFAQVETAKSLEEARARLQQATYDLILLDLTLGDGSGAELIPHLCRASPNVPIVIFSANEVEEVMANQVAAALVKSRATNEQLLKTIQTLVDRQGD
jgi:PAS domain S-box-containing protein